MPLALDTTWLWTGSLYAWFKLFKERSHPDAQWETRKVAWWVDELIECNFPISWAALKEAS